MQLRVPLPQVGVLGHQLEVLRGQLGLLHFPLRDSVLRKGPCADRFLGERGGCDRPHESRKI